MTPTTDSLAEAFERRLRDLVRWQLACFTDFSRWPGPQRDMANAYAARYGSRDWFHRSHVYRHPEQLTPELPYSYRTRPCWAALLGDLESHAQVVAHGQVKALVRAAGLLGATEALAWPELPARSVWSAEAHPRMDALALALALPLLPNTESLPAEADRTVPPPERLAAVRWACERAGAGREVRAALEEHAGAMRHGFGRLPPREVLPPGRLRAAWPFVAVLHQAEAATRAGQAPAQGAAP